MNPMAIVVLAVALAFMAESMVEYVFGAIADHVPALNPYRWLLMYVSLAVGLGLAFFYNVDLIALITQAGATWMGVSLTGLSIGRGAQFVHDFVFGYILGD